MLLWIGLNLKKIYVVLDKLAESKGLLFSYGIAHIDHVKRPNPHVFYVVAEDNGKIVSTIRATIVDVDLAELRHEVFPDKETGKGLVEKMLNLLKEKKMRKVIARTIATDKLENEIYKELDWIQEGLFKDHYRKGTDIIQYAKFL